MKRFSALLLALLLIVCLGACSAPASNTDAPVTSLPQETEPFAQVEATMTQLEAVIAPSDQHRIAVIAGVSTENACMRMAAGVQEYASMTGLSISMQGTTSDDPAQQEKLILEQVKAGVDAICVVPIDASAIESALKQAKNAGIKVIVSQGADMSNIDYDIEAASGEFFGAAIMDCLAEAMNESGAYTILVSSGSAADENAWADSGALHQQQVYPLMSLLPEEMRVQAGETADAAYAKTKELIEKHSDLKGIMCTSPAMMQGAAKAIDELGLSGSVFVSGWGEPQANQALLNSGVAHSFVTWDPAQTGKAMCALAVKLLRGEEIGERCDLGVGGYNDVTARKDNDTVLEGQAWTVVDAGNVGSFGF